MNSSHLLLHTHTAIRRPISSDLYERSNQQNKSTNRFKEQFEWNINRGRRLERIDHQHQT